MKRNLSMSKRSHALQVCAVDGKLPCGRMIKSEKIKPTLQVSTGHLKKKSQENNCYDMYLAWMCGVARQEVDGTGQKEKIAATCTIEWLACLPSHGPGCYLGLTSGVGPKYKSPPSKQHAPLADLLYSLPSLSSIST